MWAGGVAVQTGRSNGYSTDPAALLCCSVWVGVRILSAPSPVRLRSALTPN